MAYFMRSGLDDDQINSFQNSKVKERLDLNCMQSEDLMLEYFSNLAVKMTTPTEYYGHLAIKAAYMEETRGNVTIFIKDKLAGVGRSGHFGSSLLDSWSRKKLTFWIITSRQLEQEEVDILDHHF
ncbi:hypothetical protein CHS0354_002225 [Potamilus streckersoni]|uniref:Uncharacterized protein n=1 Tax=Potamilus streckersoni TaxID=2493646 RepID=A0AAE0TBC2_9BIVA|nr:hypothetical protein CHS0354_002225 [Potamilus streckersoni]